MWTYEQATGWLFDDTGAKVAPCYSGKGEGLNNPSMQNVKDVGPIPQGHYTIGELEVHHPRLGGDVLPLIPDLSDEMFGRDGFFIHGDNSQMNDSASEGCIVAPHPTRLVINESQDKRLVVVSGVHEQIPAISE